MDKQDKVVFFNRGCVVLTLLCVVGFLMLAMVSRYQGKITYSNEVPAVQAGQSNPGKGNLGEVFGIGIVAVLVLALLGGVVKSFGGYSAHRRKEHASARIVYDRDGGSNTIEIINLDDVDIAEFPHHREVNWSSLKARVNHGGGKWVWVFQYMGDSRTNEDMSDPYHLMYMRDAEKTLNVFLKQVINPAKDRE
jgi:hypothetical protein